MAGLTYQTTGSHTWMGQVGCISQRNYEFEIDITGVVGVGYIHVGVTYRCTWHGMAWHGMGERDIPCG